MVNVFVYEGGRGFGGNRGGNQDGGNDGRGPPRGGRECFNCGEMGHISRACPRKAKSAAPAGDAVLSGGVEKSVSKRRREGRKAKFDGLKARVAELEGSNQKGGNKDGNQQGGNKDGSQDGGNKDGGNQEGGKKDGGNQ